MKRYLTSSYFDRRSGEFRRDPLYAGAFLDWSYNTISGRFATRYFFSLKPVSGCYGWLQRRGISKKLIRPFVERMHVDMDESIKRIEDFDCFNDFFVREIDLRRRPVCLRPEVCVSPADCRILVFENISADSEFPIKRSLFNLRTFLVDDRQADKYDGGILVVCRIYLPDYHHFHFPDSGIPLPSVPVEGRYYALGDYSRSRSTPCYCENRRTVTPFLSDHFGEIAIVEIGAFTVGSICQTFVPNRRVEKGARKGYFEVGGSTVALLFQKHALRIDRDISMKSREGIETYVRVGESIGRAQS
ncbi:MAG: phosphatidylserine decarboxylase [Gammaproteobacteria bacterium]